MKSANVCYTVGWKRWRVTGRRLPGLTVARSGAPFWKLEKVAGWVKLLPSAWLLEGLRGQGVPSHQASPRAPDLET